MEPLQPYDAPLSAPTEPSPTMAIAEAASPTTAASKPGIWPVAVVLLLGMAAYLTASVLALVIAAFAVHGKLDVEHFRSVESLQAITQSKVGFPLIVVIPQLAMVVPALIAASFSPQGVRQRLGLVRGHWPLIAWLTAALATPLIGMISSIVVGLFMEDSESLVEMTKIFREFAADGFVIPLALLIGATPGICEELLFRGYVQPRLSARFSGLVGVLFTSVLFAAFHFDLVHSTAVFALGFWLGWICWQSGSIFPAMIAHFVNNSLSVFAVSLGPPPGSDEVPLELAGAMLMAFSLGSAALLLTLLTAWKYRVAPTPSVPAASVVVASNVPADPLSPEPSPPEPSPPEPSRFGPHRSN